MAEIKVRKGAVRDIPQLIRLYSGVKELADFAGQKHDSNYFISFMKSKNNIVLVAEKDNNIRGALNAEFEDLAGYAFLTNIVVSEQYRNQKVGRVLMKTLEEIVRKRKIKRILGLVYDYNDRMHYIMRHYKYVPTANATLYSKKVRQ